MEAQKAFSSIDKRIALKGGALGAMIGAILTLILFSVPAFMEPMQQRGVLIGFAAMVGLVFGFLAGGLIAIGIARYRHHTATPRSLHEFPT